MIRKPVDAPIDAKSQRQAKAEVEPLRHPCDVAMDDLLGRHASLLLAETRDLVTGLDSLTRAARTPARAESPIIDITDYVVKEPPT